MDNQTPESSFEPTREQTVKPVSGIEWKALGVGLGAALVWHFSQAIFFSALIKTMGITEYAKVFSTYGPGIILQVSVSLAHGTFVGFVTAWVARHHLYVFAIFVNLLAFIAATGVQWFRFPTGIVLPTIYYYWMIGSLVISLLGALNGAWLAQSSKRRRVVRIQ